MPRDSATEIMMPSHRMAPLPNTHLTPLVVPVFLPHWGCPHQCIFCNQHTITGDRTGEDALSVDGLRTKVSEFRGYTKTPQRPVQLAFYGGNFLGLHRERIRRILDSAQQLVEEGLIDSLRFSTRPDTIDPEKLDLLKPYTVSTIELGAQSMDDRVLERSSRGHSAHDTLTAARLVRSRSYHLGLQMMIGLPGDEGPSSLRTAIQLADLEPDFVRIYPTVVLSGSPLAEQHRRGTYTALTLEAAVSLAASVCALFRKRRVPVARLGLHEVQRSRDGGEGILAGPFHQAFGHLVYSAMFLERAVHMMEKADVHHKKAILWVHPRCISRMRGQHNKNITHLEAVFNPSLLKVKGDERLAWDDIRLQLY